MLGPQYNDETRDYLLVLQHPTGDSLAGDFTGSETFEAELWAGEDRTAIALTASWATPGEPNVPLGNPTTVDSPVVKLTVLAATVAGLEGVHDWRVTIPATDTVVASGRITLVAAPGSATAPATYCTLREMKDLCPIIESLSGFADSAGFADARGMARVDFDHILQRTYRGPDRNDESSLDHLLDGGTRWGEHDATLQTWLDAGRLVLTTPAGKRIRRWNALMACYHVLRRELGERGDEYRSRAMAFKREADAMIGTLTAEIDTTTTPDGVGDLVISLACHDTIRG
jgi:hypothetical protein